MGSNIPLPALAVQAPQPTDALGAYQRMVSLGSLLQQQKLGNVDLQQKQIGLQDQQATTAAMHDWDGKSLDDLPGLILKHNGSANAVFGMKSQILSQKQEIAKLDTDTLANQSKRNDFLLGSLQAATSGPDEGLGDRVLSAAQDAIKQGYIDPQHAQSVQSIASLPPDQLRSNLSLYEKHLMGAQEQFEQEQKNRETSAAEATSAAKTSEAQTAAQRLTLETPGIQAQGQISQQNLAANPTTIALGQTEKRAQAASAFAAAAKSKAETANLGEQPIFAVDPATGERVMTTRPEAKANGYTNPVAVKEGDVSKETDARAMINDVQLNKSRYASAMQRLYAEPVSSSQAAALTALLPEHVGIDFGSLFKLELPDMMQKVTNAESFKVLSPAQKQAVVGYYSTLASVPAAQKALTNIGRSNKEVMDMELRTVPTPIMDPETFGTMLNRFQGNIDQTSKKTVRIPGMPATSDIRDLYEGKQQPTQSLPPDVQKLMRTVPLSSLLRPQQQQ